MAAAEAVEDLQPWIQNKDVELQGWVEKQATAGEADHLGIPMIMTMTITTEDLQDILTTTTMMTEATQLEAADMRTTTPMMIEDTHLKVETMIQTTTTTMMMTTMTITLQAAHPVDRQEDPLVAEDHQEAADLHLWIAKK